MASSSPLAACPVVASGSIMHFPQSSSRHHLHGSWCIFICHLNVIAQTDRLCNLNQYDRFQFQSLLDGDQHQSPPFLWVMHVGVQWLWHFSWFKGNVLSSLISSPLHVWTALLNFCYVRGLCCVWHRENVSSTFPLGQRRAPLEAPQSTSSFRPQ